MLSVSGSILALLALACGIDAKNVAPSLEQYRGQHVVQVIGADTREASLLVESEVHEIFRRKFDAGGMTARVSSNMIGNLRDLGFEVNLLVDDVAEHMTEHMTHFLDENTHEVTRRSAGKAGSSKEDPEKYFGKYHHYMDVHAYFKELAHGVKLPKGASKNTFEFKKIGSTVEKRPIYAFEIGNPKAKHAIYMQGHVHAEEWIASKAATYSLQMILDRFQSGKEADLFDKFRFIFVPLINVDGFRYSYQTDRMWRKNRGHNKNETCPGINLNRNFNGFGGWKQDPNPCDRNYGGDKPYSEPETLAMVKYLTNKKKKHDFCAMFDIHSFAEYIVYPYGYDFNLPDAPNRDQLQEVGDLMAEVINNFDGSNFTAMNAADWYPASGATDDWWYDKIARGPWKNNTGLAYTVEMRPQLGDPIGKELPIDQILPACKEWYAGFSAAINWLDDEIDD